MTILWFGIKHKAPWWWIRDTILHTRIHWTMDGLWNDSRYNGANRGWLWKKLRPLASTDTRYRFEWMSDTELQRLISETIPNWEDCTRMSRAFAERNQDKHQE